MQYTRRMRNIADEIDLRTIKWVESLGYTFIRKATFEEDTKEYWDYLFSSPFGEECRFSFKAKTRLRKYKPDCITIEPSDVCSANMAAYHAWCIEGLTGSIPDQFMLIGHEDLKSYGFDFKPMSDGTSCAFVKPSSIFWLGVA